MSFLWLIIKGMFIGIANVIPGVSGGTMAVSFGIYDDVIHAFTHIKKEMKASAKVLVPLIVGVLAGVAGFSRMIEFLLVNYTFATAVAFVGLILGGIPILWKEARLSLDKEGSSLNWIHAVLFVLMFGIVAWMGIADVSGGGVQEVGLEFSALIALFFVGVISAAAMVIPGISGSLLMLIIGYYYAFIFIINGFTTALSSFDTDQLVSFTILVAAYGLGMVVGIVVISKIIDYLFKNHPGYTYASILGLVFGSPIAIFTNTEALAEIGGSSFVYILISLLLGIGCFILTYALGKTDDPTEELNI